MAIPWKAVEQYFTVELFIFPLCPVCNCENFINVGLGTVRSKGLRSKDLTQKNALTWIVPVSTSVHPTMMARVTNTPTIIYHNCVLHWAVVIQIQ